MGTRNPHTSHDLLLLLHHLPGPHGAYDDCEYSMLPPLSLAMLHTALCHVPSVTACNLEIKPPNPLPVKSGFLLRWSCYCGFGAFQLLGLHKSDLQHPDSSAHTQPPAPPQYAAYLSPALGKRKAKISAIWVHDCSLWHIQLNGLRISGMAALVTRELPENRPVGHLVSV